MGKTQRGSGRGCSVIVGLILLILAVVAVLVGRDMVTIPGLSAVSGGGDTTRVAGVIGSEKRAFFEDPEVREVFASHGYDVSVDTAGSRRIATDVDLDIYDFAFPASAPAGQKIAASTPNRGTHTPFHSPMAVATFEPILGILEREGVARHDGGHWFIDMEAYIALADSGRRWNELGSEYPSPRTVQISSTDIRTSNSAAMYLAILAWVSRGGAVTTTDAQVREVTDAVSPLFVGQGYTESTSAGPFADYLAQGMGARPLVMVYEAQFLGEQMAADSRIRGDMVVAYPDPTINSTHMLVALNDTGGEIGRLLSNDPQLQRLAAKHGFRPGDPSLFADTLAEHEITAPPAFLATVDPPDYDRLEELIDAVGAQYTSPAPPEKSEE
ncbi:MAG: hypothetical protein Q4G50_02810 [Corynebacterium sp.]|uniref:hypothetical protein n=1 Tax=Corynebacterium sp. TaxID=1720 RepID=UPI0026E0509B|nr:hypothetical protein [Corynebacterium sp.]MDO5668915.1 hypothetical protein [Corynebacterium sp.]